MVLGYHKICERSIKLQLLHILQSRESGRQVTLSLSQDRPFFLTNSGQTQLLLKASQVEKQKKYVFIWNTLNGLAQNCGDSIADALELAQSCAKPLISLYQFP